MFSHLFLGRDIIHMGPTNQTRVSEFLLLGLSEKPEQQLPLFGLFLSMYMVALFGNMLIIVAIVCDSHLHTPMYFFISNLSLVDFCLVSTTVPKMLTNILTHSKTISYSGCFTQIYFFSVFACMENFLLGAMAYDRFVAICHPLRYMAIMNPLLCVLLVLISCVLSLLTSLLHGLMMMHLSFCKDHEIPYFFCEITQVLKLACSDTLINSILIYFTTGLLGIVPLTGILTSYTQICFSILKFPSAEGKYKAFFTCGSHLCVVLLFYGTAFGVYMTSSATRSSWKSIVASVMYAVVTPMLNPFIYSLRNKDIKDALKKFISRSSSSQ
ncbi:olfactory receptor 7D4-like [Notamacropus eugenii]|uniref:olfactory receptor 7D4-like n=1 Tax=Notamacropus eugenii TaxID=9315 RepID=UPI003B684ABF